MSRLADIRQRDANFGPNLPYIWIAQQDRRYLLALLDFKPKRWVDPHGQVWEMAPGRPPEWVGGVPRLICTLILAMTGRAS